MHSHTDPYKDVKFSSRVQGVCAQFQLQCDIREEEAATGEKREAVKTGQLYLVRVNSNDFIFTIYIFSDVISEEGFYPEMLSLGISTQEFWRTQFRSQPTAYLILTAGHDLRILLTGQAQQGRQTRGTQRGEQHQLQGHMTPVWSPPPSLGNRTICRIPSSQDPAAPCLLSLVKEMSSRKEQKRSFNQQAMLGSAKNSKICLREVDRNVGIHGKGEQSGHLKAALSHVVPMFPPAGIRAQGAAENPEGQRVAGGWARRGGP
nr:uncharacterized protein LOC111753445 [Cavia porcellus]